MKVLIADDEPTSRLILGAALTRFGHSVELVEDGTQAWAALEAPVRPRLAILDWNMPGLAGPEVCRKLRARQGGPYTYAILVTTRGKAEAVVQGLEAGADDYIAKPFDPEELRARVRAGERIIELQRRRIARALTSTPCSRISTAVSCWRTIRVGSCMPTPLSPTCPARRSKAPSASAATNFCGCTPGASTIRRRAWRS